MRPKKKIQLTHNRVLLSEVLPYETPLFFSNRFFYRLSNYYGLTLKDGEIICTKHSEEIGIGDFVSLLNERPNGKLYPFTFNVNHQIKKWDDYRRETYIDTDYRRYRALTLIHPAFQLEMVDFYNKYHALIIYYCTKSNFSLRYPYKKAHLIRTRNSKVNKLLTKIDTQDSYENLKHYFAYKKFNNINNFFDDYSYLKAERKFNFLLRLDIEKCFESIAPNALSLAIYGTETSQSDESFVCDFKNLMDKFNSDEKKAGIIIGPEFSRIYAEMIFQAIDNVVENELERSNCKINRDYECYRYVDDVYFFFNEIEVEKKFKQLYAYEISKYGLRLNMSKEKIIERPLVDNKFIAKKSIEDLLITVFDNQLDKLLPEEVIGGFKFNITPYNLKSKEVILRFRNIVKDNGVNYKDIMSFTGYKISNHIDNLMLFYDQLYTKYVEASITDELDKVGERIKEQLRLKVFKLVTNIIESIFFFIASDFRMSNIHSMVTILNKIVTFADGYYLIDQELQYRFDRDEQIQIKQLIHNEIVFLLKNCKIGNNQQIEMSYLLTLNTRLGNNFLIQSQVIKRLFEKITEKNYFSICTFLILLGNNSVYDQLKQDLLDIEVDRLIDDKENRYTELIYFVIDLISCPYLDEALKKDTLRRFQFSTVNIDRILILGAKRKNFFAKWNSLDINKESIAKRSQEVY